MIPGKGDGGLYMPKQFAFGFKLQRAGKYSDHSPIE